MFKKDTFAQEKIATIEQLCTETIPGKFTDLVNMDPKAGLKEYSKLRIKLNMELVQLALGGEGSKSKKTGADQLRFGKKLPTAEQATKVSAILNTFIKEVEQPLVQSLGEKMDAAAAAGPQVQGDITDIPAQSTGHVVKTTKLPELQKINRKAVNAYLFGSGTGICANVIIDVDGFSKLISIGQDLRKHDHRNAMLLVGGIVLLIAGIVATVLVVQHMKNKRTVAELEAPEVDISDAIDAPTDTPDDGLDAPVVDVGE